MLKVNELFSGMATVTKIAALKNIKHLLLNERSTIYRKVGGKFILYQNNSSLPQNLRHRKKCDVFLKKIIKFDSF